MDVRVEFPVNRPGPNQPAPSVQYLPPSELSAYIFDKNHVYSNNGHDVSKGLKHYDPEYNENNPHSSSHDLNEGFETFTSYEEAADPHLDDLLHDLKDAEHKHEFESSADFITYRGMLTHLLTAQYDRFAEFSMKATSFDGQIFIEEDFEAKQVRKAEQAAQPPRRGQRFSQAQMSYWGYKYEAIITLPEEFEDCSHQEIYEHRRAPVENASQYISVVETGFGNHKVVIGGEVDAIQGDWKPWNCTHPYVELKTSRWPFFEKGDTDVANMRMWEGKMLKWWAQSFLLAVRQVVIGLRDDDGVLLHQAQYDVNKIPRFVQGGLKTWSAEHCVAFLDRFLTFLKAHVSQGGVWRISLRKTFGNQPKKIVLERVEETGTGDIVSKEFKEWRAALNAGNVPPYEWEYGPMTYEQWVRWMEGRQQAPGFFDESGQKKIGKKDGLRKERYNPGAPIVCMQRFDGEDYAAWAARIRSFGIRVPDDLYGQKFGSWEDRHRFWGIDRPPPGYDKR